MSYEETYHRNLGIKKDLKYFLKFHGSYGYTEDWHRLLMLEGFVNRKDVDIEDKIKAVTHTLDTMDKSNTRENAMKFIEEALKHM